MKKLLLALLASLLVCGIAAGATDISGKWAGAPFYFTFKQDGNKLSGSGGPSEKEQIVTFDNGTVDGDHIVFKAGSMQVDLRIVGDEIRGEIKNGDDTLRVFLKRAEGPATGPQAFDVASVKRMPPPAGGVMSQMDLKPGRLTCSNVNLKKLIMQAYRVKDFQVSGPDWLNLEIYDITATMPPATSTDQVLLMMQSLLAERFQLVLHHETKEVPMSALVVAKGGLKIKEGEFGRSSTSNSSGHLTAQKIPMAKFAEFLAYQLGSPVTDMTGTKGFFDFTLEWTPAARPGEAAANDSAWRFYLYHPPRSARAETGSAQGAGGNARDRSRGEDSHWELKGATSVSGFQQVHKITQSGSLLPRKAASCKPTAIGLGDYGQVAAGRLPIGRRLPTCPA